MKIISILFFLFISNIFANEYQYPKKDFSSPRATMNYYLKAMKGYKLGDPRGLDLALETFHLDQFDPATRESTGILAAKRLINTLDRLEYVDITKIPLSPERDKYLFKRGSVALDGREISVEISLTKNGEGLWKFSQKTIDTIEYWESFLIDRNAVDGVVQLNDFRTQIKASMPAWTGQKLFLFKNGQWLALIILLFLAFLMDRLAQIILANRIVSFLNKKNIQISLETKDRFTLPFGFVFATGSWTIGIHFLEFNDPTLAILYRGGIIFLTIASVFTVSKFVDVISLYLHQKAVESSNKIDDILVPLFSKTAKFFVFAIGLILVGQSLTLDMKSILAGMGIGGIAFALAAKDTIGNLFGSLTVILDRPFSIGDWVLIDGNIEGTVQEVGLRSTRVRTFYDSVITVPNGKLTNATIDNYGQRTFRRFSTKLGVQYDTPVEKIEVFCEGIRQIILKHPYTRKDYFHVYFNGMADSSLEILLYLFWKVPDWSSELQEKHRLLIDIVRLAKEIGVEFAFPTTTVHLFQESKNITDQFDLSENEKRVSETASWLLREPITTKDPRSAAKDGVLPPREK